MATTCQLQTKTPVRGAMRQAILHEFDLRPACKEMLECTPPLCNFPRNTAHTSDRQRRPHTKNDATRSILHKRLMREHATSHVEGRREQARKIGERLTTPQMMLPPDAMGDKS